MSGWTKWDEVPPTEGTKICIVCDDGSSSATAFVGEGGEVFHGEDGGPLGEDFLKGSIWSELPKDYPLSFMEVTEADWY